MNYTLKQLSQKLDAALHGDPCCEINGAAALRLATAGEISFIDHQKYRDALKNTKASAVVLTESLLPDCPVNALVVRQPRLAFAELLQLLYADRIPVAGIHPAAIVGEHSDIHLTAVVGANTVIGNHVKIGANTVIYPNVTIYDGVCIGADTVIHSGAVIGADGFGFEPNPQRQWVKVPQIGSVVIGDSVEIGANTTIDRGALEDTVIGSGVRIDNQVMIAHNVQIGEHTLIAGCTGIAGSTQIGRYCMIGGYCAISGHLVLVDGVVLTGCSMVTHSLKKSGVYSSGTGILPRREWQKCAVHFRQLDRMHQRLTALLKKQGEKL